MISIHQKLREDEVGNSGLMYAEFQFGKRKIFWINIKLMMLI